MSKNKHIVKIYASSHRHYYVMDKVTRSMLMRGNANSSTMDLDYHMSGFDFYPTDLVESDTREEAMNHLRIFKKQLKNLKFIKEYWKNLVVVSGSVLMELEVKD